MDAIIHFKCDQCEWELQTPPTDAAQCVCPECGRNCRLLPSDSLLEARRVDVCAVCGHDSLYIQKDFSRAMGIAIVAIGVLTSLVLFAMERAFLAMMALVAVALVDAAIYWMVGEVTVCYACHAIYRGFERNPRHQGFDLELLERYGGQRRRR